MSKTSWYRPANTVGFFPATPNAVLAKKFQEILTEELGRLKMYGRIIEESGVSLRRLLVKTDLTGCIFREDGCRLCASELQGGSHTRRGANYSAICTECETNNIKSIYYGETGKSGAYRVQKGHQNDIKNKDIRNALAKHLHNDHPEREGDQTVFKFKVESTDKSCLQRQVREGANLAASEADHILNSLTEYHQPSLQREEEEAEKQNLERSSKNNFQIPDHYFNEILIPSFVRHFITTGGTCIVHTRTPSVIILF